jgi:hypothetical protein
MKNETGINEVLISKSIKEREINKPRFLTGYFTLPDKNAGQAILHFKNPYLARL